MQYKILASDLDKTLLDNDGNISPENWAAIEKMQDLGVQFVPTTGRSFKEMPQELQESPAIRYYITSSGAVVYDKKTGKSYDFAIRQPLAREALDGVYQYPICLFFHADNNTFAEASTHNAEDYSAFHMNSYWIPYTLKMLKPVEDLKTFAYNAPEYESFTAFFKNREDLEACKAFFGKDPRLQVCQTDPWNMEICNAEAGKGAGIRRLAELLDVPIQQTIAVGDSLNDMTMLKTAGLSLAMSNALPEVKAVADAVICSNLEHGMAYILDHYIAPCSAD